MVNPVALAVAEYHTNQTVVYTIPYTLYTMVCTRHSIQSSMVDPVAECQIILV